MLSIKATSATQYLEELSSLALGALVTDKAGNVLSLDQGAETVIQLILTVRESSHKVLLVGNGGSAALVSHTQNDLCKAVDVPAMVFTEQPLLIALANDDGFGSVYEQPVRLWAQPDDLLIAVSSSGKSENILRAVQAAIDLGCTVVTFSGFAPDNPLRKMGDLNFYVSSEVYGYVETAHGSVTHYITDRAMTIIKKQSGAQAKA